MSGTATASPKKRSNGIETREKILDAAAQIACERGYEGTSISLVSKRAGYPASSIYWHFKDKDDLIAAVIERSYQAWAQALRDMGPPPEGSSVAQVVRHQTEQTSRALQRSPDFLRLGLMLAMEHRPQEATARTMFLKVRADAYDSAVRNYSQWLPALSGNDIQKLVSFLMAMFDGLFIAREVGEEAVDLIEMYDIQSAAVLAVIDHLGH